MQIFRITYKKGNKEFNGTFIKTPSGYLRLEIEEEKFVEISDDEIINQEEVNISIFGKIVN